MLSLVLDQARINTMAVDERLELISRLWDSIADADGDRPVPVWHHSEVMRHQAEADADPKAAIPWEQARDRLLGRP